MVRCARVGVDWGWPLIVRRMRLTLLSGERRQEARRTQLLREGPSRGAPCGRAAAAAGPVTRRHLAIATPLYAAYGPVGVNQNDVLRLPRPRVVAAGGTAQMRLSEPVAAPGAGNRRQRNSGTLPGAGAGRAVARTHPVPALESHRGQTDTPMSAAHLPSEARQ